MASGLPKVGLADCQCFGVGGADVLLAEECIPGSSWEWERPDTEGEPSDIGCLGRGAPW